MTLPVESRAVGSTHKREKHRASASGTKTPAYVFLKQTSGLGGYFRDLCVDIPRPDDVAFVYSDISEGSAGNVRFIACPAYSRRSRITRVASWVAYLMHVLFSSAFVGGDPLLFIVAQPPFLPIVGYLQRRLLGRKFVVWIDDVYPDVIVRRGILSESSLMVCVWRAINREIYRKAEHVFTISNGMRAVIQRDFPDGIPITVVPTWVDTDAIFPVAKAENPWAKQNGVEAKFTVMYSGNFGETHDVESILVAARQLREIPDIHFLFVGGGARWGGVMASVQANRDPNVTVLPWQPVEVLRYSLSSADVSIVSLDKGIEGVSMPSKTYTAMAAGAAIIACCRQQSDLAEVVRDANCGVVVEPGDILGLAAAIRETYRCPEKTSSFQRNARTAAIERYSRRKNTEIVRDVLEGIRLKS
jgi:glycosyltransferase involved in cell wall biosynthesis